MKIATRDDGIRESDDPIVAIEIAVKRPVERGRHGGNGVVRLRVRACDADEIFVDARIDQGVAIGRL
jgi:hypothetical protein